MILERGEDGTLRTLGGSPLRTHEESDECLDGCVIHHPSLSVMSDWVLNWRSDRGIMERICPEHEVGHPDFDQFRYWLRTLKWQDVWAKALHGCCGCCSYKTLEEE